MQTRIEVNKGQILALLVGEGFCGGTQTGHPIQLSVPASNEKEARMNVRYRVELGQTEREELAALLSGGKHPARRLKRAQILLAADAGASTRCASSSGRRFCWPPMPARASRKLNSKEEARCLVR